MTANNKLEFTPRLYTSERWGKSFKSDLELTRQEFVTRSSLFDSNQEHEMLHWVCLVKIVLK